VSIRDTFSEEELTAVREASRAAERRTGAEIVCVVVGRSDDYEQALAKGAALGALAGAAAAALWQLYGEAWLGSPAAWVALPTLAGAGLGLLAVLLSPALRRGLVREEVLARRVHARALEAFVEESLAATRERTGVLLFLGLFEHRVEVLCDRGVQERVPQGAWQGIVEALARGIREGRGGASLVEAVNASAEVLVRHGVARQADDVNELPDEPRVYEE
jgi:putative membrane protein